MILAADALDKSLRLDVGVTDYKDPLHAWRGGSIEGFYNAHGAYSADRARIREVVHMPWLTWAGSDIQVAVAALHSDERPFIGVFTNRPRLTTERGQNSYRPRIEEVSGFVLASEIMSYDHNASRVPVAVSRAVGETASDRLFLVQAVDTGSYAILTAQLTNGALMPEMPDPVRIPQVSEQSRGLVMQ